MCIYVYSCSDSFLFVGIYSFACVFADFFVRSILKFSYSCVYMYALLIHLFVCSLTGASVGPSTTRGLTLGGL